MGSPKAILFDFGGTLDADGLAWKERFHALYRDEGLAIGAEAFAPLFYAADDRLATELPRSAGLRATVDQLSGNLDSLLPGSDPARRQRVASRFLADSHDCLTRNRPILRALSSRFRLGVVSNFYGNLAAVCREVDLAPLLDVVVDSAVVGATKPDPAIFAAALGPLDLGPAECVFVGDSLRRDWVGAARLGMPFIWIEHPSQGMPEAEPPPHRAPSVTALPAVLGVLAEVA